MSAQNGSTKGSARKASARTGIAPEVAGTAASGIRAIANAAWARPDAVHLEFGEPDFDTPAHVVEAAARAARDGHTRYGPSAGLPALREAVTVKLARDNAFPDTRPEQVVVTAGGVGALFAAYRTLLSAGDEILVPDPGWPNFSTIATILGAVPRGYRLGPDYAPDYDDLAEKTGPNTKAILINSPSNPVGYQWSTGQLEKIGDWARRHHLTVISDECYDQLWLDQPAPTFAAAAPETPHVTVFSLSKSYAMTGWRVGYAVTSPELAAGLARVQEVTASCVNTIAQHAAIAALTGDQHCVAVMRTAYRERRDVALAAAQRLGLAVTRPAGAFYLWLSTETDAQRLLNETGTAVAPGEAFGPAGAGHLRLSLAAATEHIVRGLNDIANL